MLLRLKDLAMTDPAMTILAWTYEFQNTESKGSTIHLVISAENQLARKQNKMKVARDACKQARLAKPNKDG